MKDPQFAWRDITPWYRKIRLWIIRLKYMKAVSIIIFAAMCGIVGQVFVIYFAQFLMRWI